MSTIVKQKPYITEKRINTFISSMNEVFDNCNFNICYEIHSSIHALQKDIEKNRKEIQFFESVLSQLSLNLRIESFGFNLMKFDNDGLEFKKHDDVYYVRDIKKYWGEVWKVKDSVVIIKMNDGTKETIEKKYLKIVK